MATFGGVRRAELEARRRELLGERDKLLAALPRMAKKVAARRLRRVAGDLEALAAEFDVLTEAKQF